VALQARFVRCKARKLMFKPYVVQGLSLLQLLFQFIHCLLPLFNDTNTHIKLLRLLDGAVGSGPGRGVQLLGWSTLWSQLLMVVYNLFSNSSLTSSS
jgi:hypothetical protein